MQAMKVAGYNIAVRCREDGSVEYTVNAGTFPTFDSIAYDGAKIHVATVLRALRNDGFDVQVGDPDGIVIGGTVHDAWLPKE